MTPIRGTHFFQLTQIFKTVGPRFLSHRSAGIESEVCFQGPSGIAVLDKDRSLVTKDGHVPGALAQRNCTWYEYNH